MCPAVKGNLFNGLGPRKCWGQQTLCKHIFFVFDSHKHECTIVLKGVEWVIKKINLDCQRVGRPSLSMEYFFLFYNIRGLFN